jgi:hypothetical protein
MSKEVPVSLKRKQAGGRAPGLWARVAMILFVILASVLTQATAGPAPIRVIKDTGDQPGLRLEVEGRDFMVFGMNWGYMPIGQNYMYDFWRQPDDFIEQVLAREMPLLQNMGVNTIRQYVGIPPRWVQYIYERYGIYTVVNHPVARYGYTLDGVWIPSVDYADPHLRAALKEEIGALVDEFKGTPGMLMWLLGNENNYGLHWTSFEIEALPEDERNIARARHLYSLFDEITGVIKERDRDRPVAIANGDIQYIDVIAEECKQLDILGTNCYRGISARDLFEVVDEKLGIPVLFTEFGADAWNAKDMREDQEMQARYLIGQWQEIYEQSSGKGRVGNAIGGIIFQWSDGWWKFRQEERLDVHDTNASWPNGGYIEDYVEGENNMNEEWWGITAKGWPDHRGLYDVYPRAAYYALRRAFKLDPYAPGTDLETIRTHFEPITPGWAALEARGDRGSLLSDSFSRVRLSGLRLEFETYNTGGYLTTTPRVKPEDPEEVGAPAFRGFDRMESFYAAFQAQPVLNVTGMFALNILGNVPENRIDQIFYENRGRARTVAAVDGDLELSDIERVKVYQAAVSWDDRWFRLEGFYRTGHFHWGYEGDFFGLYREAYYGQNIDIYNAEAPAGFEIAGKKRLEGLKVAFGPQLWWGANPSVLLKYQRRIGPFDAAGIFQEDIADQFSVTSSIAVPLPSTRKATLMLATTRGPATFEIGGIWSGSDKVGDDFKITEEADTGCVVLEDEVLTSDAFGAKAKVTVSRGRWNWYAQAAYMGLVAEGGPTAITTFTGWNLKDSGSGNQTNFLTGLTVDAGNFQFGPNFLWQKPIVGPIPPEVVPPWNLRNVSVLEDPFEVRANRETVGGELVVVYDPTPATWMWAWDNNIREDARLAASLTYIFRHHPTTQDAATGILEDGKTPFAFGASPPPHDLWEIRARLVSRLRHDARVVAHLFAGTGEASGDDPRLINRYGCDGRLSWGSTALELSARFNDWGPYDYHRDGNETFPINVMADLSQTFGAPRWFGFPQTRIGVRGRWRSLDEHSPRYVPAEFQELVGSAEDGDEWEIRTYLHVAM